MGGAITVSSEAGVGSTFAFTVRMAPAAPQEEGDRSSHRRDRGAADTSCWSTIPA